MKAHSILPLVSALCLTLTCMPAFAQVSYGVAAGVNYNSLNQAYNKGFEIKDAAQGYSVGAFIDLRLGPLGLRPGVFYLNAAQLIENGRPSTANIDANFVSVPVDLMAHFPIGIVPLYIALGPDFRFPTSAPPADQTVSGALKQPWIAGNVGVGVEMKVPLLNVIFAPEARYSFSLTQFAGETITVGGETFRTSPQSVAMFMLRGNLIF